MKTIFTLILICVATLLTGVKVNAQNCNTSAGSNGNSLGLVNPVNVDGNMSDWAVYLNDPDNNSYDNTNGFDLDILNITNASRDLVRFTFTEDADNLYFYLERAGGSSNVDLVFYVDVNNNNLMDSKEPVFHIDWHGNGNVDIEYLNYNPSILSALVNTLSLNLDGAMLLGTLSNRGNSGPGSSSGKSSADGKKIEVKIPFTKLTRLNASNNVINQLSFGQDFKFHVSTINGNVSSIPAVGSIDDNFGGCLSAPQSLAPLPVKLASFTATLNTTTKVDLKWTTASEINTSHFVVERSIDGANYSEAGVVFAYGNASDKTNYSFSDNIAAIASTVIYYRLRSVDMDGKAQYSETRIIRIGKQMKNDISIVTFPNPVTSEVRISIPNEWQNKKVIYEIMNANGQVTQKMETASSSQTESINMNNLARGFYLVRVTCEGQSAQQKIIKQ